MKITKVLQKLGVIKLGVVLLLLIVAGVGVMTWMKKKEEVSIVAEAEASLQEIVEISELSTVEYSYNAIARKFDEENNPMYYVAYEGYVTAGIDFSAITIDKESESNKLIIQLPPITIHGIRVDMGSMEYIFVKGKYETETISQEAYALCIEDLENRVEQENILYDTAKENAIATVEALFAPWIESLDDSYTVEITGR